MEQHPTDRQVMTALHSRSDLNGDRVLSGTELVGFKAQVTNGNGTTMVKTLGQIGITQIDVRR